MVGIRGLWLPIVLASVIVFVASSIIHMLMPWHKGDYPKLDNEDQVLDALRPLNLPPGDYLMPRPASAADMKSPEFREKVNRGPRLVMTVMPSGMPSMAGNFIGWILYLLVVSGFSAYVTGRALPAGANYLQVFRFAGASAFLAYAGALWQLSIWYRRSWRITIVSTFDGLLYALLTAGTFGWLWPR